MPDFLPPQYDRHDANPIDYWNHEPMDVWLAQDRPHGWNFNEPLGYDFTSIRDGTWKTDWDIQWVRDRIRSMYSARRAARRLGKRYGFVPHFRFDVWHPSWYSEQEWPDIDWHQRVPFPQFAADVSTLAQKGWSFGLSGMGDSSGVIMDPAYFARVWNHGPKSPQGWPLTVPNMYARPDRTPAPAIKFHHYVMDVRIPAYREWVVDWAARMLDRWNADAVQIGLKQGINEHKAWAHWSNPRQIDPAWATWEAKYWVKMAVAEGKWPDGPWGHLCLTDYAEGEYQDACSEILVRLHERTGVGIYVAERPAGYLAWTRYMARNRAAIPATGGEDWEVWMSAAVRKAVIGYMP